MGSGDNAVRWRLARFGASRTIDLGGARLHEIQYSPRATFPPHSHESSTITLVLRGQFEEDSTLGAGTARVCSVLVKPAGAVHANRFDASGVRTIVLEIDEARREEWPVFFREEGQARIETDLRAARAMLDLARRVHSGAHRESLCDVSPVLRALGDGDSCPEPNHTTRLMGDARAALESDPASDRPFAELADDLGLHRVTLSRAYRDRFGCTMSVHRRRLRVSEAAQRIARSNDSLARIAAQAGFADQSHMTRSFGQELGLSPGAFRRLSQSGV
jgi:AraC family transcriptional regulator